MDKAQTPLPKATEGAKPSILGGDKPPKALSFADVDIVYEFRISRRANPPEFKNLWKLEARIPGATVYDQLIDADMLSTALQRIGYVFEADGL
jgi:hypothetical protein